MEKRTGGCHCKAVRYEVEIDLNQPVIECNCSHCQIKGLLLSFVPEEKFTHVSGEDNQTEYHFNTHKIHHTFCKTCGVQSFGRGKNADGSGAVAINVRTIDDIDLSKLTRMPYDGRSK
jgi:hypothetical protein